MGGGTAWVRQNNLQSSLPIPTILYSVKAMIRQLIVIVYLKLAIVWKNITIYNLCYDIARARTSCHGVKMPQSCNSKARLVRLTIASDTLVTITAGESYVLQPFPHQLIVHIMPFSCTSSYVKPALFPTMRQEKTFEWPGTFSFHCWLLSRRGKKGSRKATKLCSPEQLTPKHKLISYNGTKFTLNHEGAVSHQNGVCFSFRY